MKLTSLSTTSITPTLSKDSISLLKMVINEGESIEIEVLESTTNEHEIPFKLWGKKVYWCKMLSGEYEGYFASFGEKQFKLETSNIEEEDMLNGNYLYPGHETWED